MAIQVEFFGIPRARVGIDQVMVLKGRDSASISEVFSAVGTVHPDFVEHCMCGEFLRDGFIANIDGNVFVRDGSTVVHSGQSVLVLSADAGG